MYLKGGAKYAELDERHQAGVERSVEEKLVWVECWYGRR